MSHYYTLRCKEQCYLITRPALTRAWLLLANPMRRFLMLPGAELGQHSLKRALTIAKGWGATDDELQPFQGGFRTTADFMRFSRLIEDCRARHQVQQHYDRWGFRANQLVWGEPDQASQPDDQDAQLTPVGKGSAALSPDAAPLYNQGHQ